LAGGILGAPALSPFVLGWARAKGYNARPNSVTATSFQADRSQTLVSICFRHPPSLQRPILHVRTSDLLPLLPGHRFPDTSPQAPSSTFLLVLPGGAQCLRPVHTPINAYVAVRISEDRPSLLPWPRTAQRVESPLRIHPSSSPSRPLVERPP
jgi:hypothetical protein